MILLIEDNPGDVVLFQKALRATTSSCTVAHDAAEANRLLAQPGAAFAVAVVDLRLPGSDGWVILESLNAQPAPRVEVVILTSSANDRDCERAAQLGIKHYWIKPDDFPTLQGIIHAISALDRPR